VKRILAAAAAACALASGCQHRPAQLGRPLPADYGLFYFEFELDTCPKTDVELPAARTDADSRVYSGYLHGPYCHGYLKYGLESKASRAYAQILPLYARLARGTGCRLHLALPTARTCAGVKLSECEAFRQIQPHAERFARVSLAGTGLNAKIPAAAVRAYASDREFARWCDGRTRR
jgi:hypothetical protein